MPSSTLILNSFVIIELYFQQKVQHFTSRVFYEGNLRSYGNGVCNRWYFTFDGAECTKPATIQGIVSVRSTTLNPYRHRHIEGYCNEVPKGHILVGLWIGKCDSHIEMVTLEGDLAVSRIGLKKCHRFKLDIIEENEYYPNYTIIIT